MQLLKSQSCFNFLMQRLELLGTRFPRAVIAFQVFACALLYSYANILTVMLINRLHTGYMCLWPAEPFVCFVRF